MTEYELFDKSGVGGCYERVTPDPKPAALITFRVYTTAELPQRIKVPTKNMVASDNRIIDRSDWDLDMAKNTIKKLCNPNSLQLECVRRMP